MLFAIVMATIAVRQHLELTEVARAIDMLEMGFPQHQVADSVGVSQSIVTQLWSQFQETVIYQAPWARLWALYN